MPAPIPVTEFTFRATRAGGPGGQHVNRSSTRIELWWNVLASPSLTEEERARLRSVLDHRIDGDGWIRVVSSATRSQSKNRDAAVTRLQTLVAEALVPPRPRRKTRPPRAAAERRLEEKKRRSATKAKRRRPPAEE